MKRSFTILLFLIAYINMDAGNSDTIDVSKFVAVYNYKCNTKDATGNQVTDSIQFAVQVGQNVNKSEEYYTYLYNSSNSRHSDENWQKMQDALKLNATVIYQNYPEGRLTSMEAIPPHKYITDEVLPQIKWSLTDDTMRVEGYLCHQATTQFGDRSWSAWYTEEIPSSAGPWKLHGLPGLILYAKDKDNIFSFMLCGMMNDKFPIIFTSDAKAIKIESSKFIKYRNSLLCNDRYLNNPGYYLSKDDLSNNVTVFEPRPGSKDSRIFVNGVFLPQKAHAYQPLELK
jgi:GLPGLI family protein